MTIDYDVSRLSGVAGFSKLRDFNKDAELLEYGNKADVKTAVKQVKVAEKEFRRALDATKMLDGQKSTLLFLSEIFSGIVKNYLNTPDIQDSNIYLDATDATNLAYLILQENNNTELLRDIKESRADSVLKMYLNAEFKLGSLLDVFDRVHSNESTESLLKNDAYVQKIANTLSKRPENVDELIIKHTIFVALYQFAKSKYEKIVHPKDAVNGLENKIKKLQEALEKYVEDSGSSVFIPGIESIRSCNNIMNAFVHMFKVGEARRERAINTSESIIVKQQRMQNVKNMLEDLINTSDGLHIDDFKVSLPEHLTLEDFAKVDNYRTSEDRPRIRDYAGTMETKIAYILDEENKGKNNTLNKNDIKSYAKALQLALKEITDKSSEALIRMQEASYRRNTAADNLSMVVRKIFDVFENACLLPKK